MCLAVPGKVVEWLETEPPFRRAAVQFGATRREVSMECVPAAQTGDYVLVHAGIAISAVDSAEARRMLELFEELDRGSFDRDDRDDSFGTSRTSAERPPAPPGARGEEPAREPS